MQGINTDAVSYHAVMSSGVSSGLGGELVGAGRAMPRLDYQENGFHSASHDLGYVGVTSSVGGGGGMIDISDFNDLRLMPASARDGMELTGEGAADLLPATDMDTLSREIEKERSVSNII